jgi:hypothetical protein
VRFLEFKGYARIDIKVEENVFAALFDNAFN